MAVMLVVITTKFFSKTYLKIEFSSQWREMLLLLITNMAAVTSRANQELEMRQSLEHLLPYSNKIINIISKLMFKNLSGFTITGIEKPSPNDGFLCKN